MHPDAHELANRIVTLRDGESVKVIDWADRFSRRDPVEHMRYAARVPQELQNDHDVVCVVQDGVHFLIHDSEIERRTMKIVRTERENTD